MNFESKDPAMFHLNEPTVLHGMPWYATPLVTRPEIRPKNQWFGGSGSILRLENCFFWRIHSLRHVDSKTGELGNWKKVSHPRLREVHLSSFMSVRLEQQMKDVEIRP